MSGVDQVLDGNISSNEQKHDGLRPDLQDLLKSAGLKLKAKKCTLCITKVRFLGHIVSEEGISTDPEKIKAVKEWPTPTNITEVHSFLCLCGYYRKFIKSFAHIAKPLHKITEKETNFVWTSECQASVTPYRIA
ncbi:uncharacterized protein [Mytilus edulis]|uniref:uncharacterized protein n=1 Tax=Mytilus edulis TaxID=6550 RepID=UPI0039F0FC27